MYNFTGDILENLSFLNCVENIMWIRLLSTLIILNVNMLQCESDWINIYTNTVPYQCLVFVLMYML